MATPYAPMTAPEILAAATLLQWVSSCQAIKFATEDGEIRTAHVRSIDWRQGHQDIRSAEVRLTLSTGWEDFWSGAKMLKLIRDHEMVPAK